MYVCHVAGHERPLAGKRSRKSCAYMSTRPGKRPLRRPGSAWRSSLKYKLASCVVQKNTPIIAMGQYSRDGDRRMCLYIPVQFRQCSSCKPHRVLTQL
ncbi:hypothetical protein IF2G_03171 [Cordyceps javanica]|nr:hypothetical protein IF2G_03171 [Cordyceps javanica]